MCVWVFAPEKLLCPSWLWQQWNAMSTLIKYEKQIIVENSVYHSVWTYLCSAMFASIFRTFSVSIHWHLIGVMRFHCIQTSRCESFNQNRISVSGAQWKKKKLYKLIWNPHQQTLYLHRWKGQGKINKDGWNAWQFRCVSISCDKLMFVNQHVYFHLLTPKWSLPPIIRLISIMNPSLQC